ncbi:MULTISPECIES: deaminated glutathione amidase [Herbaspirillum]|uniref:Hydrolase n=1 Tax=Herbaspirillum rubrisubalbicans Os34 TaxID=1235827 RepID=A0A6M3ZS13_9BURK|nr:MULTISPECIES: deaminated glutathione amidase [Herbaspirillum]MCP1572878.1 putative amidohydrolase [Herbaspirillum rubrisubalbicans]QJQ01445.1 hydrolase [Herbaspirillum rubrisubalbicans Os34]
MLKVALGQFAVAKTWQTNLGTCLSLIRRALEQEAQLLVLPEGILARDITDPDLVRKSAQALDGPFVSALCEATRGTPLTLVTCVHVPLDGLRVANMLIVIRDACIIARYQKLHLYDAFTGQESRNVEPGNEVPPLVEVGGMQVGVMTCYDLRFPELARRLALDGAQVLVLPAAWVKGPLKEMHWETLLRARAVENTTYLVAVGECGERNIGCSMVVDPLGVPVVQAAEASTLVFATLDPARLAAARAVLPVLKNRRFSRPELQFPS